MDLNIATLLADILAGLTGIYFYSWLTRRKPREHDVRLPVDNYLTRLIIISPDDSKEIRRAFAQRFSIDFPPTWMSGVSGYQGIEGLMIYKR